MDGEKRVAAGEAAAAGAAGRPSWCGWWMAMAGRLGSARTPRLGDKRVAAEEAAAAGSRAAVDGGWPRGSVRTPRSGGCGKEELLWMADANTEVGEDLGKRRQRGLWEGRAAVDGGRQWQGARETCEIKVGEEAQ